MHCFPGRASQPSTYTLHSHYIEKVLQVLADVLTAFMELLRNADGKDA